MKLRDSVLAALVCAGLFSASSALAVGSVVISQIYGGGGNTGAPWQNDYVEIYNRSGAPVDISGWSVQYASATGTSWSFATIPAATTLATGSYLLVKFGPASTTGSPLPAACIIATNAGVNLAVSAGKVALVQNAVALSGACPLPNALISDLVGYGTTASCSESFAAPTTSNTTALQRKNAGGLDTDNNSTDFVTGSPVPCTLPTHNDNSTWGRLKTIYR